MLGKLDLGSEEGEDHFMKMMHGMMSTLLSKEVLYPSLVDLCKQVQYCTVDACSAFADSVGPILPPYNSACVCVVRHTEHVH